MSDFKKSLQLLWMRNRIWLISLLALSILGGFVSIRSQIESKIWSLANIYIEVEHKGKEEENYDWREEEELRNRFVQEGVTKKDMEVFDQKSRETGFFENRRGRPIDEYDIFVRDRGQEGALRINGTKILAHTGSDAGLVFLALVLALIFGALEHITSFYEFKRSLPWRKGNDYLAKITMGFGLLALSQIMYYGIAYSQLRNSPFSQVLVFPNLLAENMGLVLTVYSAFAITFSLGQLAGSFLGQIGLAIIGFSGLGLPLGIVRSLEYVFLHSSEISNKLDKAFTKWPELVQGILFPGQGLFETGPVAYGAGLVGFCLLLLGYFWHKKQKAERTGMLILPPRLSKLVFWIAVVTTSCLGTTIFSGGIFLGNYSLLGLPILVLMTFISYKFYRLLFSVRIGL